MKGLSGSLHHSSSFSVSSGSSSASFAFFFLGILSLSSRETSIHLIGKDVEQVFKAIADFSHIRNSKTFKMKVLTNIITYLEIITSKLEVEKVRANDLKLELKNKEDSIKCNGFI